MTPTLQQPAEQAAALVAQGEQLFAGGDFEQAERLFRQALTMDPGCGGALNNLAVMAHQAGDIDQAERLLLKAAVIGDTPVDALLNLSSITRGANRLAEATRYLEQGLAVGGETPRLLDEMGRLTEAMGQIETARGLFHKSRAVADLPPVPYRAAFAEVDITPAGAVELQGYFGPPRTTETVDSRLKLQALLLEDGYGSRALFVGADIFGFDAQLVRLIRHRAAEWGIDPAAVVLNASHTHYGPGTVSHAVPGLGRFDAAFAQGVVDHVTKLLPRLYLDLAPAELAWGRAAVSIGFNRRRAVDGRIEMAPAPESHYETETPILAVKVGKRRLLMVNHGCHPTGSGPAAIIGADYPGALRARLAEKGAAETVIFLQGAAGDIKQGVRQGDRIGWIGRPDDARTLGGRMAEAVADAATTLTPIRGPLDAGRITLNLPLQGGPIGEEAFGLPHNQGAAPAMLRNWAAAAVHRYGDKRPETFEMELGILGVGEVAFALVPGEPMAVTARRMRLLSTRHDALFVLGYTNGLEAYVPADEMVAQGGYEAHVSHLVYTLPSPFARGAEATLLDATRQACAAITPAVERPPLPAQPAPAAHPAFFVMSTGRSGTQTLAGLFEMASNAKVWHHPEPNMIMETLHAYWDAIDRRSTFWAGRGRIIREAWDAGVIHGETDHNMTPFCDVIADDIPDARFLILVRDPREFVRSGMRRGYYRATGAWESGRLRPREDDPRRQTWLARPQFEQVSWLWAETYRHVERLRKRIGEERVRVVRFEDLIAGPDEIEGVFDFLGLDGFDRDRAVEILGRKLNAQKFGDFPHPRDWTAEMNARCWDAVGPIAKRYGYARKYRDRKKGGA